MIFWWICAILVINLRACVGLIFTSQNRRMEKHKEFMGGVWKA